MSVEKAFVVKSPDGISFEIIGPDGGVVAWVSDEWSAHVIARLLNENEEMMFRKQKGEE